MAEEGRGYEGVDGGEGFPGVEVLEEGYLDRLPDVGAGGCCLVALEERFAFGDGAAGLDLFFGGGRYLYFLFPRV